MRLRNRGAFFDEDAAAIGMPAARTASTNRMASGNAVNSPASMNSTMRCCLRSAYAFARVTASGTPKCSSAPSAPLIRGLPEITRWYTSEVNASGDQVVRSRMSAHSPSISSRSAWRQARSWGESTSTPSTSKIAP